MSLTAVYEANNSLSEILDNDDSVINEIASAMETIINEVERTDDLGDYAAVLSTALFEIRGLESAQEPSDADNEELVGRVRELAREALEAFSI